MMYMLQKQFETRSVIAMTDMVLRNMYTKLFWIALSSNSLQGADGWSDKK